MLITISELKTYLKITDSSYDSVLLQMINFAQSEIENYCRQPIASASKVIISSGTKSPVLLPYFPVNAITVLKVRQDWQDTWEILASTKYSLVHKDNLYYLYCDYLEQENYIDMTIGYTTAPADIKKVAIEMIALMFKESDIREGARGESRLGVQSIATTIQGIAATTTFKDEKPRWHDILKRYRKPIV